MSELNNDFLNVEIGDEVTGTVVKIEDKQALIDFGYKTEGILPIGEISNKHIEKITDVLHEDEEVTLLVKKVEDEEVVLSKRAVDNEKTWKELEERQANETVFETTVTEVVKGGLVVDVGLRGFIPASMVETFFVEDFSDYQGKSLEVKVMDLDRDKNRIILSHRAVVEAEQEKQKEALLETLEAGQTLTGTVQRLTDFGAFVDIGGVDGLVHISELAHEHVVQASDVVTEGEEIEVEVLSVDRDNERISLSRKNVIPGPWSNIGSRVQKGDVLTGTVKRLVDFGAFVEVFPGVEGLVHVSEIANRHIAKPSDVLEPNEKVEVKVLDLNEEDERISLSIRALEEESADSRIEDFAQQDTESSGFQFGDIIGDQLNKYKE